MSLIQEEKLRAFFKKRGRDSLTGIVVPLWFGRLVEIMWIVIFISVLYDLIRNS